MTKALIRVQSSTGPPSPCEYLAVGCFEQATHVLPPNFEASARDTGHDFIGFSFAIAQ